MWPLLYWRRTSRCPGPHSSPLQSPKAPELGRPSSRCSQHSSCRTTWLPCIYGRAPRAPCAVYVLVLAVQTTQTPFLPFLLFLLKPAKTAKAHPAASALVDTGPCGLCCTGAALAAVPVHIHRRCNRLRRPSLGGQARTKRRRANDSCKSAECHKPLPPLAVPPRKAVKLAIHGRITAASGGAGTRCRFSRNE